MPEAESPPVRRALRRLAPLVMPGAYLVFTLLVFWRLWTPIEGGHRTWRYDPRYEYWGDLAFQADTVSDGELALWNPHDRAGFPLYGDPQPGMLYPPNWPFAAWGAVTGDVPYRAITIKILLHWLFGAIGMHLFLRRLRAREPACYVGGVLFGWTAPKIRYGGSALNWSIAWLPWVLLALHWFSERPDWRRGAVLGTATAMLLLAGAPAVVLYMLLFAIPYGLYALRGRLRASLPPLGVAAGVTLMWLLPLVVSNLQQLGESWRQTRDVAFITDSVFTPAHFLSFLVPRFQGEPAYYGLLPILCAGALVASKARGRALVFLGIAAFGVLLALGRQAGVLPSMASLISPFGLFRRAHRYLYVTSTAMAVLAGLGLGYFHDTEEEERRRALARRVLWIGGATTFAIGIAYLVAFATSKQLDGPRNVQLGLAFASCAVGTWLLRAIAVNTGRRRTVYAWMAAAAVALDIWTAGAPTLDQGLTAPPHAKRDADLAKLADVTTEWRVYDRGYFDYRPGTRLRIRDFGGYEDDPLGLVRYRSMLDAVEKDLRLLGHANVRYYLSGDRQPRIDPKPKDGMTALEPGIFELSAVAPAVMYVPAPVRARDAADALKKLRAITPGEGAVVEADVPSAPSGTPVAAGRITELAPNYLAAEIDAPGPGLIVVAEAYYPAWSATVNGEDADIVPANLLFRGVAVQAAGHYRIEMRLRPLRFWLLLPFYLGALGLFVAALWRRRRSS